MSKPNLIYFGTPNIAIPPLRALIQTQNYEILAVITQPDAPSGRGNKISPSPVKRFAEESGLKVFCPSTLRGIKFGDTEKTSILATKDPSQNELAALLSKHLPSSDNPIAAFILVAYGKIIPKFLIDFPQQGIINLHLSLLPTLRGAAPIQRAIMQGLHKTGVSLMKIDQGLDTGPVYAQTAVPILPDDDSGILAEKLSLAGSKLLIEHLPQIINGSLQAKPQSEQGASYAAKLEKSDFIINWQDSSSNIAQLIRAASPTPGATTNYNGQQLKIFRAQPIEWRKADQTPGQILEVNKGELIISCGQGALSLLELQLAGKKRLAVADFLRGINVGNDLILGACKRSLS